MNASVALIVNLVASAGEVDVPVIVSSGANWPLSGDATPLASILAPRLFRLPSGAAPHSAGTLITASLVAYAAYWSPRLDSG